MWPSGCAPVAVPVVFGSSVRRCASSWKPTTYVSTLRSFLGWGYMAGLLPVDWRPAVTAPRRFKQRGIRDVLSGSDVTRILAAVDRSSATGRRDYAVLMLAARYGLRPAD